MSAVGHLEVLIPVVTGCLVSSATSLVSYVAHEAAVLERKRSRVQLVLIDVVVALAFVGGCLLMTALFAAGGSVALGVTTRMATTVLCNMFMQQGLGIKAYSRSMQIGTWVLVVAVCQMTLVGPSPRGDIDAFALISRRLSQTWCVALLVIGAAAAWGIVATHQKPMNSRIKILVWSLLLSVLSCIADNLSAFFGLLAGQQLTAAVACFVILMVVLTGLLVKAPARCEAAVFVPMQFCVQLVVYMVTGILLWDDHTRVHSLPAYLLTYVMCILGACLASEMGGKSSAIAEGSSEQSLCESA